MNDTIEYTLFSDINDVIEQFDIKDNEDVIEHINERLSLDLHVIEWKYDYNNDIFYGIGKNCYDDREQDSYVLCNADTTMYTAFKAIMENLRNEIFDSYGKMYDENNLDEKMNIKMQFGVQ